MRRITANGPRLGRIAFRASVPLIVVAALASVPLHGAVLLRPVAYQSTPEADAQTTWASCNANALTGGPSTFTPVSDAAAAALVTHEPETRTDNATPYTIYGVTYPSTNSYVPSAAQLATFWSAKDSLGQPILQFNPYLKYVDGLDGLKQPSTDDLIQWGAHKWGIPENWLRAEYVLETYWDSFSRGDLTSVSHADYPLYPPQSRVRGQFEAYQSLGISQVRWDPEGDVSAGTEPLRHLSTAFNIDYQAAMLRFYYDNPGGARKEWGDSSYVPCQQWNSIGAWYDPYPWGNSGQAQYVSKVQSDLAATTWETPGFLDYTPTLPANVTMQ